MESIVLTILFGLGLLFSYIALEVEKRIYTVVYLLLATLAFGAILLYIEALYIGLFYILVYSGLLSVLFASISNFLEEESTEKESLTTKQKTSEGTK